MKSKSSRRKPKKTKSRLRQKNEQHQAARSRQRGGGSAARPSGQASGRKLPRASGQRSRGSAPAPSAQGSPLSTVDRILAAVKRIPRGKVSTYGDIADVAGLPRRARLVGTVLRQTPGSRDLPWFRVINAGGRISFPAGTPPYVRQRSKLEAEGVVFIGDRVNLKRYGWPSRDEQLDEYLWKPR